MSKIQVKKDNDFLRRAIEVVKESDNSIAEQA